LFSVLYALFQLWRLKCSEMITNTRMMW